jgi:hypothetical protein
MQVLKNIAAKFSTAAKKFDRNQDGMETIQVVMIIAVSAIVLFFVRDVYYSVADWTVALLNNVLSWVS